MMNLHNKRGVSLVAVLLFMLVATIAATATYKWLTSEERASSSRMRMNSAYQSSLAGMESARTWMTYHANDVGSLIKQYKQGGNKPVRLNLKELARADQRFDVWLVGVNTEHSTYKLKILSSGRDNSNTTYNLVGIFNVDGLYQVTIPKKKRIANVDFDYAYFGGSSHGAGAQTISSAIINGNWSGNPQHITNNLIVTGNVTLSGHNITVDSLSCVGGNVDATNNGLTATDLYVVGNYNGRLTTKKNSENMGGDAYFEGDATQGSTGAWIFDGSVTLNGTMKTNQASGSDYVTIKENLCVTNSGKLISTGTNSPFTVQGNVWMPGTNPIYTGRTETDNYDKVILGTSSNSKLYIADGYPFSTYKNVLMTKEFTENSAYKKYCAADKQISSNDIWDIVVGNGGERFIFHEGQKDICGSWGTPAWKSGHKDYWGNCIVDNEYYYCQHPSYYVYYTRGWTNWEGNRYKPYKAETEKDGLFYFYHNEPGIQDVEFKEATTNWKHFTGNTTYNEHEMYMVKSNGEYSYYVNGVEYRGFKPDPVQISQKFASTTAVGSYFVGGQNFYDFNTKQYNNYNVSGYAEAWSGGPLNPVPTGSPYCYKKDEYHPECRVTNWFKSSGSVVRPMPGTQPPEAACAESVKDRCLDILGTPVSNGCDGSKFKVPDLLVTGVKTFESYAQKGCAATITEWNTGLVKKMNDCYDENINDETKKNTNLYNGYLVVKVDGAQGTQNCPTAQLKGNFVLMVNDKPIDCQNGLPPLSEDSHVLLYLNKGADNIGGATRKNYFIYSKDEIVSAKNLNLTGTVYATAASCAGIGDMQSSTLTYDPELMSEMVLAGLICEGDDEATCGGVVGGSGDPSSSGSSSTSTSEVILDQIDSFYVANAPTLSISLESQYKSDELLPTNGDSRDLAEDFIVVPRIIYMSKDPYGELQDYYNVVGLNGLQITKTPGAVSCDAASRIRPTDKLYDRSGSDQKLVEGMYECSYTHNGKSVSFYVNVSGDAGTAPYISFTEGAVEMGASSSYEVKIDVMPHSGPLTVEITKPDAMDGWTFSEVNGSCSGNKCSFTIPANNFSTAVTVFNVTTSNVDNGTAMFFLNSGEGYLIGSPSTIVLAYKASITVRREPATADEIEAYCNDHTGCPSSTVNWPECTVAESWVKANGTCNTQTVNQQWSCGLGADVALEKNNEVGGCIAIIPENTLSKDGFVAGNTYTLHASLKKRPMTFKFGFSGEQLIGKTIVASTDRDSKRCTYGTDITSKDEYCQLVVFSGEQVTVRVENNPDNFNYWSCQGASCPEATYTGASFSDIVITEDNDIVIAHFDETDKHCFFDEFESGLGCEELYCIRETSSGKWKVLTDGYESKLDYKDGYIAAKPKSNKDGVIVLSNTVPGTTGSLKAQFQVPQVSTGAASRIPQTVRNSGFVLRSNADASNYLLLSLYGDNTGALVASLCPANESTCKTEQLKNGSSTLTVAASTVVTLTASVSSTSISLSAVTNRLGAASTYTATFSFSDGVLAPYANTGSSIGFRLADPNFNLYDFGWKSDTYGSECWDTYPTVSCSFRSAYAGGVVPKDTSAKPWVGLSSWFDTRDCQPSYYYQGDDACSHTTSSYGTCISDYVFTEKGTHGYTQDGIDIRTAKAGVKNCYYLRDENDQMLAETAEQAHCGEFWVGELSYCKQNVDFFNGSRTVSYTESFNLPSGELANLREAELKIDLENASGSHVEIYLLSQSDRYSNPVHSKSYETTSSGTIVINVESLIDADNFDPESVYGVTVNILEGSGVTITHVYTSCPNVVSLTCNEALTYNATAGAWLFSANMTNYSQVKSFRVSEKNSYVSAKDYDCQASDNPCSATESGKNATFSFDVTDNPYASNAGKDYQFKVEMVTLDDKPFECETGTFTVPSVDRSCGSLSTSSVKMGAGLPQFNYSISNCPSTGCPYKITLEGAGGPYDVFSGSGNTSGSTASNNGNSSGSPLEPGTYKFVLQSVGDEVPFESCESAEFTVRSAAADYDVECGVSKFNNSISGGTEFYTTDNLYFVSKLLDSEDNEVSLKVLVDESNIGSVTINKYGYSEAKNIGTLPKGTYKYSLNYANEEVCSHTITIKDAGDEVEASCASVTVYPNQSTGSLITMSGLENINSSTRVIKIDGTEKTRSTNCNKYYCEQMSFNAPTTTGSYEYKLYFNDTEKCSGTVTVNSTLSCSVNTTDIKLGQSFTFTASYGGSCSNTSFTGDGVSHSNCQTSYTIQPTTVGNEKEYAFNINGSVGNGSCTVKVNVSEDAPTATCPTTTMSVEPGQNAAFEPISVTGCSAIGCDYTIKKNGSTVAGVNDKSYKGGATTPRAYEAGTYTFEVKNSAGSSSCGFEVAYRDPSVSCSGTYNIEPTENVTFSPTVEYCSNCAYTITQGGATIKSGTYNGGNVTFTSEAEKGTKSYVFTVTNSAGRSDNCSVDVTYKTPSVECPTEAYSVEPGTTVNFTPASLSNCSKGCDYKLEYVSTSETKASKTDKSYTSASAVQFTRGTGLSSTLYKFTVTNRGGASDDCTFDVNDAKPTFTCPAGKTVSTGTNVAIEPTNIKNCTQGCDYKVSGGSANLNKTGNTTSGGSYNIGNVSESVSSDQTFNYTVTISNDAGTNETPCSVPVKYTAVAPTESADCWYSATEVYVGDKVGFTAKNIKPADKNVDLKFDVDEVINEQHASFWTTGSTYDRNQSYNKLSFTTPGAHTIKLSINGIEVCNQTITVNDLPSNVVSTDWKSYAPGQSYNLQTMNVSGPRSFKCRVTSTTSYERTVATANGETLKIPAYNSVSNGTSGIADYTSFTLVVRSDAPSDLECALSW